MKNCFVQKSTDFLRAHTVWVLSLLFFILLLRLVEHWQMASQLPGINFTVTFLYGLLNDFGFALSFGFMLCVPLLLVHWCKRKAAFVAALVLGCLFLLITAMLSRYFVTTKTLLGADFFGYSLTDIRTTITSSAAFAVVDILPVLLLIAFVFVTSALQKRARKFPVWIAVVMAALGLCAGFFYNAFGSKQGPAEKQLVQSKGAYFVMTNLQGNESPAAHLRFEGYPLLHNDNSRDALTPYMNLPAQKPNIVFLIVEGLGRDFTGPGAQYSGFTPFLDSLSQHGLYWTNFLSSAGRSFAGLPSILGSLPYGQNGFNDLEEKMPAHQSLVSLLKQNGYRTNFFYGGNANFDHQDLFLEKQGIDYILDENKFGPGYQRRFDNKYSWGYADGDLYRRSLDLLSNTQGQPLLNIYFTLSTHEPFTLPDEAQYEKKVAAYLDALPPIKREVYTPHKDVWKALLYSDESIRTFMANYAKRNDFANTIFIITGDHRLIPVPEEHALSRFRVPLLIYSPLLKRPASFAAVSSHLDIAPSLMQLLRHHSDMRFPSQVHWLGQGLDTARQLSDTYEMPFMRNKNELNDYLYGRHFLSGDQLFEITGNLQAAAIDNNALRDRLKAKLDSFRQLNQYLCRQNKLSKQDAEKLTANTETGFSVQEERRLDSLIGGFTEPDTLFARARRLAFSGAYEPARLLCRKVLAGSPNYHDVRVLYGRTFAWEKSHHKAAEAFAEVLRRDPGYEDAYLAWIDAAAWADKKDSALLLTRKALSVLPGSTELKMKQAKLLAKN